ncbi:MAG: site-specific integrase [Actinomycetota bacterium]
MAWVQRLKSGRYQTVWRDPEGHQRSQVFRLKKDADAKAIGVEDEKLRGVYSFDPNAGQQSLGRFYAEWCAKADRLGRPGPSTRAKYERVWKLHVAPILKDKALRAIRRADVQDVVTVAKEKAGPFQSVEVLKFMRMLCNKAIEEDQLVRNPARGVKAPHLPDKRPQVIEASQVEALALNMPERYRALVLVRAYASLRWSEAVALKESKVDWIRRILYVDEKVVEVGSEFHWGRPKTERSRRAVPVPAVVIEALSEHMRKFDTGPDGLIFASKTGQPIRRHVFDRNWRKTTEAMGLKGFKPKNLRHTGATIAGEISGDPNLVKERLGHSSLAMVSRVYQTTFDRRQHEVAARMDEVAREARAKLAADGLPMETDTQKKSSA